MPDIRPQLRRYTAWLCALGMSYFMVRLLWMQYQSSWESFNYGIQLLVLALLALTIAVALNRPLALRITAAFCLYYAISSGFVAATMLSFDGVSLEFFYPLLTVPLAGLPPIYWITAPPRKKPTSAHGRSRMAKRASACS